MHPRCRWACAGSRHLRERPVLPTSLSRSLPPRARTTRFGCETHAYGVIRVSHTSRVATGLKVGGDVEQALESIAVPSYVLDNAGVVRWINPAAKQLVGDVRGRHFTSVVAPEDSRRARELFTQKVLGTSRATEAKGHLVSTAGARVAVEISAVPLRSGERVVGVFGLLEGHPDSPTAPPPHLTPRQVEVLRLLEQGRSTKQIAAELHPALRRSGTTSAVSFGPSASTPDSKPSPPHGPHRPTSPALRPQDSSD